MKKHTTFISLQICIILFLTGCMSLPQWEKDASMLSVFDTDSHMIVSTLPEEYISIFNTIIHDDEIDTFTQIFNAYIETTDSFMATFFFDDSYNTQLVLKGDYTKSIDVASLITDESWITQSSTFENGMTYSWLESENGFKVFTNNTDVVFISNYDIDTMIQKYYDIVYFNHFPNNEKSDEYKIVSDYFSTYKEGAIYVPSLDPFLASFDFPLQFNIDYILIGYDNHEEGEYIDVMLTMPDENARNQIYTLITLLQLDAEIIKSKKNILLIEDVNIDEDFQEDTIFSRNEKESSI